MLFLWRFDVQCHFQTVVRPIETTYLYDIIYPYRIYMCDVLNDLFIHLVKSDLLCYYEKPIYYVTYMW